MEKQSIQVLDRAFDIIEELAHSREALGLSDLARSTGLSKTTVHRILQTLLTRGYADKTREGTYTIGPELFSVISHHIDSLELQAEAKPYLQALMHQVGLTVYLGVPDVPYVAIIDRVAADRSDETFTHVGHRHPAHCSSMGKCLMASLSRAELEEVLYDFELEACTPRTITNKSDLVQHLHQVRKQGWAMDYEESEPNHRCIAAPVFNYAGDAIAVIGVSGTNEDIPDERIDFIATHVVTAARASSRAMGYIE